MKKLYSIGETAKIMGISVQTLRNYSQFPFLQPAYINEDTGYRYYTFEQFHIIDRIKYLRSFDMSLAEIQEIMMDGKKVDKIVRFLEKREEVMEKQIEEMQMQLEDLRWYVDYFKYLNQNDVNALPHVAHYPKRYVLYTDCTAEESIEDIEVRLAKLKVTYGNENIQFRRQFGYILDFDALMEKEWKPTAYFIYMSEKAELIENKGILQQENVKEFPEGDYLCFSFRLRHMEELNTNLIKEYFCNREKPFLVIANEHEDNLFTYKTCPYELQIILK